MHMDSGSHMLHGISDDRDVSGKNLIRLLDTLAAQKYFNSKVSRKKFLEHVTPEQLIQIGLLVTKAINGRRSEYAQGALIQRKLEGVPDQKVVEYQSPRIEDKKELLSKALDAVRVIRVQYGMDHAAACLVSVINALHPFSDGNGRTTRVLYWLLTHGYTGDQQSKRDIQKLVTMEARGSVNTSSTSLLTYADQYLRKKTKITAADGTIESIEDYHADRPIEHVIIPRGVAQILGRFDTARLQRFFQEKEFVTYVLARMLSQRNMLVEPFVSCTTAREGVVKTQIHTQSVVKVLTADMAEELIMYEAAAKREAIEVMIDVFKHPTEHVFMDASKKEVRIDRTYVASLTRDISKIFDRMPQ